MDTKKRGKLLGIIGALIVHVGILALLLLITLIIPEPEEESGVEVMMGNVANAYGGFNPSSLVNVDIISSQASQTQPAPATPQELLTQDLEETVALEPESKPKPAQPETPKVPEKTEAEKAAEAKKIAEEKAERERKAAQEAANSRVSGAFGRGAEMGDRGSTTGEGAEGSPTGNSAEGATTGSGGYGTFDLGGRSLHGSLPRPAYDVQEEGRVVVTITVNPGGHVISTSINRLTNTVNTTLRKAAEDAAKKARFNSTDGVNNQTGTITYYFNLK